VAHLSQETDDRGTPTPIAGQPNGVESLLPRKGPGSHRKLTRPHAIPLPKAPLIRAARPACVSCAHLFLFTDDVARRMQISASSRTTDCAAYVVAPPARGIASGNTICHIHRRSRRVCSADSRREVATPDDAVARRFAYDNHAISRAIRLGASDTGNIDPHVDLRIKPVPSFAGQITVRVQPASRRRTAAVPLGRRCWCGRARGVERHTIILVTASVARLRLAAFVTAAQTSAVEPRCVLTERLTGKCPLEKSRGWSRALEDMMRGS